MRRSLLIGGGALVALLVSFVSGRASVRTRTTEATMSTSRAAETTAKLQGAEKKIEIAHDDIGRETQTETTSDCPAATPGKTRTVTVVRERIVHDGQIAATATHAAETHQAATEHTEATLRIAERPQLPQWSAGAFAGLGLDGRLRAGPEVSRRVLGPLWLGLKLDVSGRAAMASIRVEL